MALVAVIVLSSLFAITHFVLSHGSIREGMIAKLGKMGHMGVYSVISLVTLVGAVLIFRAYYAEPGAMGERLYQDGLWVYLIVYPLMFLAFFLIANMVATPSPTGMMPAAMEPRGVLRITRHPMNMGFACFGLAHMIANPRLGDLFLFGSIFVVGFFGAYHQDRRKAREKGEEFVEFQRKTSILPFAAFVGGRTGLEIKEFSAILAAVSVILFVAMILLHNRLIGVAPY